MTKKLREVAVFCLFFLLANAAVFAQTRTIKGVVKDSKTKETVIGATVLVEGTTNGTSTDVNGAFTLQVDQNAKFLLVSYVGMITKKVEITGDVLDVSLDPDAVLLNETVVTALGISREKKSLGYATQELSGDQVTAVKSGNFVNQLSGKLSGVQIKNSGNLGGSTNIVIRGNSSILGNNQALFVIDGVPLNNTVANVAGQERGSDGYDYGNPIGDINPDDIESINVLKGSAATALYGARAAAGVVMITTKKGKLAVAGRQRFGVTYNSNLSVGIINKNTFPTYQNKYGAGYGPYYDSQDGYFFLGDVNGDGVDDLITPHTEDASYGAKFDPNLMVYQWDAFVPGHKNYKKATPWVAAGDNGPISLFEKAFNVNNSIAVDGGGEKATFRASYSNNYQKGIMPNSNLKKDNFSVNSSYIINDKFNVSISANYVKSSVKGRNQTGYSANDVAGFRQFCETNVNYAEQKEVYEATKLNYTWNPGDYTNPTKPIYWDNIYFKRDQNYETDVRNRFFGNMTLNYKINDVFNVMTRFGTDLYSTLMEERLAKGSQPINFGVGLVNSPSGYSRRNINFRETNVDGILNFKKDINEDFNISALVGINIRRSDFNSVLASTSGGLAEAGVYSLLNSLELVAPPDEVATPIGVNGFFTSASLGYKRMLFLDVTARKDYSSTLPVGKNGFFYPGVSTSFVFSEMLTDYKWLDFGKVRLNYAKVGNDAPFGVVNWTYAKQYVSNFGNVPMYSVANIKNNPDLKPEISNTAEVGLDMVFFKKRLGFDFALYRKLTVGQIVNVPISAATGFSSKYFNAGEVENKGIELTIYGTPVQTKNFSWNVNLNYTRNRNKVVSLYNGVDNLQLASFQGGVTLNATVGQPYGTLQGTDFIYLDGKKVVGANGYYKETTTTNNVLGDINPKFLMGLNNAFTYKNFTASFLVDMQWGGSIYSLDLAYGMGSGLYPETAGINDLGNESRLPVDQGGGIILDGVNENGEKNQIRIENNESGVYGNDYNADKLFIYDASYVKLREVSLMYKLKLKEEGFFRNVSFGIVGSNLMILYKNIPYADPEAGLASGNVQGYHTGVLPATRNYAFNLTFQF